MLREQSPLKPCFAGMPQIGEALSASMLTYFKDNAVLIGREEQALAEAVDAVKRAGLPAETIHKKGQMTAHERLAYLVDPGTWCPLHTLYNPLENEEGCTGVIDGLGKIRGKWAVIIAFDNKILAGAWIAGQAENILKVTDLAKRLHIPLVWILNCSGVKLAEQEKVYAGRRGNGATFYRHAELNMLGIPVLNAIYGTNPAGGGYHGISPTILLAHKDANIAVGGAGIVGGMSPQGHFDLAGLQQIIEVTRDFREKAPGRAEIHFDETGYFREVHDTEESVLDGIKQYMDGIPAYDPKFFRVASPALPRFPIDELQYIVPIDQQLQYDVYQVLGRLLDDSEFLEYRSDYGPEVFTGIGKIDGFPVGLIGNKQGFLEDYPEYASSGSMGVGGKHYRQGLVKQNEFVTFCGRDNLPVIWLQDTTGIDVGDVAEKAGLLGLGQSLVYSIEKTDVPMLCLVLRKGTAAAHYIMGGPQANKNNAFTLGTPLTEIYVMHGETAAVASYARRLVKEQDAGNDLNPVMNKMNDLVRDYAEKSKPIYCAKQGFVDEVVPLSDLRKYFSAFVGAAYQNPRSITPIHQMILPQSIRG
ncbi:glutaconyl-CoA decarboxylase subunit alpha [Deltaproteobacteria bacterium]|nr:glutaconyl-CoA decarboxylase subunit alpha [Deltaproteobacteria bacterium]